LPRRPSPAPPIRKRFHVVVAVALAVLIAAVLLHRSPRPLPPPPPRPSILLVTVDTLRADALGAYGSAAGATPWLDRLAAGGARFEDAHAHNVTTLASHANILSGRLPFEHGVRDNSGFRFPPGLPTLAELLKAQGYRTAAFVSAFPLAARFGLDRGFDVYDDRFVGAASRPVFTELERPGRETVARAREWLASASPPVFCWVHVYEPHFPYASPEPFASRYAGHPYLADVAAADDALGPLLEPILTARDGRTLVIATADHGESLGEHGEATHGIFAYEATLRVPLIVFAPARLQPGVVTAPARHVDLFPTILEAASAPLPKDLPGRSLLAAKGPAGAPVATYFEALSGQLNRGWAPLRGVIRERSKYVDLPVPEVYDLETDPSEARNLASTEPGRLQSLAGLLSAFGATGNPVTRSPESAETRERLRGLGYLGADAPAKSRYGEEDDPKRLIALDATLQEVVGLYGAGRLEEARARCRDLVARRPGMGVSLLTLAHLEREAGDLKAAVAALRKALALSPDDVTTATLLGAYLTQAGRAREAGALLEPFAKREKPDVDLLGARALALAGQGRAEDALAELERARALDPSNAMVLVEAGTVSLMRNDRSAARAAFEEALRVNPETARAWSSLGALDADEGRLEEAAACWRKAVAADPAELEKLLGLGLALRAQGRPEAARPYLDFFLQSAPPQRYARQIEHVRGLASAGP
jgi:arylsulfatase A-like enzyme/tetratricopeptide (TPR) repeat protein